jgi:type II secretory pathway component GspD/PulD (secretin)
MIERRSEGRVWKMRGAVGYGALALALSGSLAWGQADTSAAKDTSAARETSAPKEEKRVERPPLEGATLQTFYLANVGSQQDANEVLVALRNILDPRVKMILVQRAILIEAPPEQLQIASKVIHDLDRPKKSYRLTYTVTELDSGKRVGTQHFSMIVVPGQRTVMKQGNKVPIVTGEYKPGNSETQTQVTYIDVGMNFDATLDEIAGGATLKSKIEQLGVGEERSGLGPQDPVVRQTALEGTSLLTLGKPQIVGSVDIPGSTRRLDIEVMAEQVTP